VPLFHFHTRHDGRLDEDREGRRLPCLDAARQEALETARELWAEAMLEGDDLTDHQFVIADERGEHVLIVSFIDALPEGLQRRLVWR